MDGKDSSHVARWTAIAAKGREDGAHRKNDTLQLLEDCLLRLDINMQTRRSRARSCADPHEGKLQHRYSIQATEALSAIYYPRLSVAILALFSRYIARPPRAKQNPSQKTNTFCENSTKSLPMLTLRCPAPHAL